MKVSRKLSDASTNFEVMLSLLQKLPFVKRRMPKEDYDPVLIHKTQPINGIKAHENYLTLGDSYMTCIHVYRLPDIIRRHWLVPPFQMDNVTVVADVRPLNIDTVRDSINKTYDEHASRLSQAHNLGDSKDARIAMARLEELLDEINNLGTGMLEFELRIYVCGRTFEEMERRAAEVERELTRREFTEYSRDINEQLADYQRLFVSADEMKKTIYARKGIPLPSNIIAQGAPFYFVGMKDQQGFYLGATEYKGGQGAVIFDPNRNDGFFRKSYDALICGKKSSGKSTTLKMLVEHQFATGNRVRIIDVTGEFGKLVKNLGGVIVKMDGSDDSEMLNPLEILRTGENDTQNYLKHISKLGLMYKLKSPKAKDNEISLFKTMLKKLYIKFGIVESEETNEYRNITGLDSDKYPIFSDFLNLLNDEINTISRSRSKDKEYQINILCEIRFVIEDIVKSFGALFNGHTTIPGIIDADVVSYDISEVSKMGGTVYDMQLFNVLSIAYDSCLTTGIKMKELYDSGKITADEAIHHNIIIDEAQKSINYTKPFAVDYIFDIMSQDRKYFVGVWLATQNISTFCNTNDDAVSAQIRSLFELCQYKMIFQQDEVSVPVLQAAFGSILTPEQITMVPKLVERQMMFIVSPVLTIPLTCHQISKSKQAYFGGGA